jgi:putative transcriptional regulator
MKNRVRAEREENKITQEELAKKVGVSRQTINSIELNKFIPSTLVSLKISKVFQKKVNDLFFLEEFD